MTTNCKKAVETSVPTTNLTSSSIYKSDETATAAIIGIYEELMNGEKFTSGMESIGLICGLSADEFENYPNSNTTLTQAYTNTLISQTSPFPFWASIYESIYRTNAAIEGLSSSNNLTPQTKHQLLGEAKFLRSFLYFYLVNIFGNVPLITSTDYRKNSTEPRSSISNIYRQIISDLKEAKNLLNEYYVNSSGQETTERVRANKYAATALLARIYLYLEDWPEAEREASEVINNNSLYSISSNLDQIFLKNSKEAVWQLQPVVPGYNTYDGYTYILTYGPNTYSNPVYLTTHILNSFEKGDLRLLNWVGVDSSTGKKYFYPYKYRLGYTNASTLEYLMVIRLAELYLIRAEARIHVNNISGGIDDLNIIRKRAGLTNITTQGKSELLSILEHERKIELFSEWGHRWLDLKRLKGNNSPNRANEVLAAIKGNTWDPTDILYPIPLDDIRANPNLTQNPGY